MCRLARSLRVPKGPQICVLSASLVFYAWNYPADLVYLLGSILSNWLLALWICSAVGLRRKRFLQLGLVANLAFLCIFKYLGFIVSNLPSALRDHVHLSDLGLPLGISFFTITQIMYLVDCYEDLVPPSNLVDHATFVSFFPYVISGPISRAKRILHQLPVLNGPTEPSADQVARAVFLFSMGLVKKVVLADAFSLPADFGFANIGHLSAIEAWTCAIAYALQIYFDFSGYSDMAIASALALGIEVPRNFDAPFRATSIIEYWQRWHISLTSFITTYIYTPLVKSFGKVTLFTSAVATFIAMTIAGLWHGPNWTFVVFGAIHGIALAINQVFRKKKLFKIPKLLCWFMTFVVFELGFVFFRAPDLHAALQFVARMFSLNHPFGTSNFSMMNGKNLALPWVCIFLSSQASGLVAAFFGKSTDQLSNQFKPTWSSYLVATACLLLGLLFINSNVGKPFVYFKF